MASDESLRPPERSPEDEVHGRTKTLLGVIPAASELFEFLVTPPLERRREEWRHEVAHALEELQEKGAVAIRELTSNEVFLDTLIKASRLAMSTSQQEKLVQLRNAVINAAMPNAPDEAMQHMFLTIIDQVTTWHVRVLRVFVAPDQWMKEQGITLLRDPKTLAEVAIAALPELKDAYEAFTVQIVEDLIRHGLIATGSQDTYLPNLLKGRVTWLGKSFLKFIEEPVPDREKP